MRPPRKARDFAPGMDASEFTSGDYNALAAWLERAGSLSVAPPLLASEGPGGRLLRLSTRPGFWARVIGAGNPYGFRQLYRKDDLTFGDDDGGFSAPSPPSGDDYAAYEVNEKAGLGGTTQWLVPGSDGDFRFQDLAEGEGSGPPPTCTSYCVTVYRGGTGTTPEPGVTVTFHGTRSGSPWSASGTTGSDGKFCYDLPDDPYPVVADAVVANDCGKTYTIGTFLTGEGGLCYATARNCKVVIVAAISDAGSPTVALAGPDGFAETRSGGTSTWTFCSLGASVPATFPATVTLTATGTTGLFPPRCAALTVSCGGSYSVDLTQSDLGDCYFATGSGDPTGNCDQGCSGWGKGPSYRGVVSKNFEVMFKSVPIGSTTPRNWFGDDEGVWIPLAGSGYPSATVWDSGCRGGSNNYLSFTAGGACSYNKPVGAEARRIYFQSTRVSMQANQLSYTAFGPPDCQTIGQLYPGGCGGFSPCGCHDPAGAWQNFGSASPESGSPSCRVDEAAGGGSGHICGTAQFSFSSAPNSRFQTNTTIVSPETGLSQITSGLGLLCSPADFWLAKRAGGANFSGVRTSSTVATLETIANGYLYYALVRETC